MAPTEEPEPDPDPFESTEEYYAEYRPDYGEEAIRYLAERFDLDESARVLDLGCGAGQIAVPVATHAGEVVGIDPNERMLQHARDAARAAGRENVEWVVGTDPDVDASLGPLRLTTMGRAFHRMDGAATLDRIAEVTEPGGGVALLSDPEWLTRGTRDWQADVYDIASEFIDDLPDRTGPVEYDDPWDELLETCGFADVTVETIAFEREWDVDGVVGYVLSLSFCSPRTFGDDRSAFEANVRSRLRDIGRPFAQDVDLRIVSGRVPESSR